MKHLSIFVLGALLCAGLSSCEESNSVTSSDPSFGANPHGGGGSTPAANPEILYLVPETSKGKQYRRIGVCNADGSNATSLLNIGSGASTTVYFYGTPSWSGNGGSFSYIESDATRSVSYLKTSSISVVNGKPVAGNASTLKTMSIASDNAAIGGGIWSPSASEIAYSVQNRSTSFTSRFSEVRVMSSNGGSDELLYTSDTGKSIFWMSYSPDGSKIAFVEWTISSTNTVLEDVIKIIDRTTGVIEQEINTHENNSQTIEVEWSRNGANQLSYFNIGIGTYIYDLSSNTKTKLNNGRSATWSPNNDRMAYAYGGDVYTVNLSTNVSTLIGDNVNRVGLSWKR